MATPHVALSILLIGFVYIHESSLCRSRDTSFNSSYWILISYVTARRLVEDVELSILLIGFRVLKIIVGMHTTAAVTFQFFLLDSVLVKIFTMIQSAVRELSILLIGF